MKEREDLRRGPRTPRFERRPRPTRRRTQNSDLMPRISKFHRLLMRDTRSKAGSFKRRRPLFKFSQAISIDHLHRLIALPKLPQIPLFARVSMFQKSINVTYKSDESNGLPKNDGEFSFHVLGGAINPITTSFCPYACQASSS